MLATDPLGDKFFQCQYIRGCRTISISRRRYSRPSYADKVILLSLATVHPISIFGRKFDIE